MQHQPNARSTSPVTPDLIRGPASSSTPLESSGTPARGRGDEARVDKADPTAAELLAGTNLSGRRAIVTGASSGIGVAIADALAGAGAEVTLAVRDMDAGAEVSRCIAEKHNTAAPHVEKIDLLSMRSVREFARRWGDAPLDLLINNAGLMAPPLAHSEDGFESQMAVNFFAPFLLSSLLLPHLQAAAPARVVIVSSGSHHLAQLRLDDLNYHRRAYEKFEGYGHAKLCANLLAVEYSRRYGPDVTMNAVTPGGVSSNLGRHVSFEDAVRLGWVKPDGTLPQGRMRTAEEGAAPPVWTAIAPELAGRGGLYIEDCTVAPVWAPPTPPCWGVTAASIDPDDAATLWDVAEKLLSEAGRDA